MADFETKLRWLSERGDPIGAEELIERIEAELAGDPLVVVSTRRRGTLMTKTQETRTATQRSLFEGPGWAVATFISILAVGAIYVGFYGDGDEVADSPQPTTTAPDVETMTDLEVIEAGVAAFYSGDGDLAAALFELADRTDEEIRQEAAYQAAIEGRLTLDCTSGACLGWYQNAITDVIGANDWFGPNDLLHWAELDVVVEDGVITEFSFPEYPAINLYIGSFLAAESRLDGYEECAFGPFSESCAAIQLENLDEWAEWRETLEPEDLVDVALKAWYGGDCLAAHYLAGPMESNVGSVPNGHLFVDGSDALCLSSASSSRTIEYESILGADVSIEACEQVGWSGGDAAFGELSVPLWGPVLSCEVLYANAMNVAVGAQPSATGRDFHVLDSIGVVKDPPLGQDGPSYWYEGVYPGATELLESFRAFAEAGELKDVYDAERCAESRTPQCADLIMNNLDNWATWHQTNRG